MNDIVSRAFVFCFQVGLGCDSFTARDLFKGVGPGPPSTRGAVAYPSRGSAQPCVSTAVAKNQTSPPEAISND
jgi:hypothetical protein